MESVGQPIIDVRGLRKDFRNGVAAIDGLDIQISSGGRVHGFLGPNGAGKTTTIRCLLGLIRPTAGEVKLFGTDISTDLPAIMSRVGALVETPKFFPNFSGRKNLQMLANVVGISGTAIDQSLETVGLSERSKDKFGNYSLGMKQRLAIAATLLKDPELVVLDEPANGLDPAGIVEIRQLIRRLGETGRTVFVSSHQLGEVQQTCDEVMIISKGRLIRQGPVEEMVSLGISNTQIVTVRDVASAINVLNTAGFAVQPVPEPETLHVQIEPTRAEEITRVLASQNIFLKGMRPAQASLESVFLDLTEGQGQL